jgi:hypothetical protein
VAAEARVVVVSVLRWRRRRRYPLRPRYGERLRTAACGGDKRAACAGGGLHFTPPYFDPRASGAVAIGA